MATALILAVIAALGWRWVWRDLLSGGFPTNGGIGPNARPYVRGVIQWWRNRGVE